MKVVWISCEVSDFQGWSSCVPYPLLTKMEQTHHFLACPVPGTLAMCWWTLGWQRNFKLPPLNNLFLIFMWRGVGITTELPLTNGTRPAYQPRHAINSSSQRWIFSNSHPWWWPVCAFSAFAHVRQILHTWLHFTILESPFCRRHRWQYTETAKQPSNGFHWCIHRLWVQRNYQRGITFRFFFFALPLLFLSKFILLGVDGKLKFSEEYGEIYPPYASQTSGVPVSTIEKVPLEKMYACGDPRCSNNPNLFSIQTIFLR